MTITLPDDLENSIQAAVQSGQFASVDEAMAEAARLLLRELKPGPQAKPPGDGSAQGPDLFLGSIGAMWDAADELDEIVADAYRKRRKETWRDISVE